MTAQRQLTAKPDYSPREFGERLNPPRSGQWVLKRIWSTELAATKTGSGWRLSHHELRRLGGQDLEVPGHEVVASERDDKLRELNRRLSRLGAELAECVAICAELEN